MVVIVLFSEISTHYTYNRYIFSYGYNADKITYSAIKCDVVKIGKFDILHKSNHHDLVFYCIRVQQ